MSSSVESSPTDNPEAPESPQSGVRQIVVHKRALVQGRPAAYSVAGAGMPVVLLHGWALAHHTYRDVIASMAAQGCHVVAPALPGFGGTHDLPKAQFSMAGYGQWVADLLEALDITEPAFVVGHSFGGGVAIRLAHDHPERVRSMVLVNSIGGSSWRRGEVVRSIAERPLWDWGLHFPSDVWPIRQATRVLPVMVEDFVPNLLRNPRALAKVANLARRADLRREVEDLRKSGMPITILWGSRDGIIPRESFEALCVAAGVEGTVVNGSHSWLLADPERFGEVITTDVRVAKMARDLEREMNAGPGKKQRAMRRVASLLGKSDVDRG
jgi:pimeloyl-ACP methyl ester carboxylesterase